MFMSFAIIETREFVRIFWRSRVGRLYEVEASPYEEGPYRVLLSGIWATPPTNSEMFIEDSAIPNFYRVTVV